MTHSEQRAKLLKMMARGYAKRVEQGDWEFIDLMAACLDALHGHYIITAKSKTFEEAFHGMSDLTKPGD